MAYNTTRSPIAFSEWTAVSAPAAAIRAVATIAAAGVGIRRVLDSFGFSLSAVAAQVHVELQIRDGATGVGAIIHQQGVKVITADSINVSLSGLGFIGSPNTAMTIEFAVAPAAGNFERVNISGYNVL